MRRWALALALAGCGGPGSRARAPIVSMPQTGLFAPAIDPRPAQLERLLEGYLWRAEDRSNAGDPEAARRELEAARVLARFDPRVNLALGSIYRVLGENEAAHAALEMAARFAPYRVDVYWMDGELSMDEGDLPRARIMLELAEARAPEVWRTRWLAGRLALAEARYDDAVLALDDAIEGEGAPPAVWGDLGDALRGTGALVDAEAVYESVLEVDPEDARALEGLAAIDAETAAR